ncbi:MAG TPA: DUF1207 domain-containing protein [Gemmatimonadales bacterium]|nr:DUF1207 domain-containing protein [Gemmatimonadales bacterium]
MKSRSLALAAVLLVLGAIPGRAQSRWLPDVAPFAYPLASPRVTGLVGRYIRTTVSDNEFGPGTEGEAAIGANLPIVLLRGGEMPISLGLGTEVYGRFNLTNPKSALVSNDWTVGFNVKADLGRWRPAFELYHESSHLGDEYRDDFNATRIDWTRELATGWLGFEAGPFTFTGGITRVLRDQLGLTGWAGVLAADFRGGYHRPLGIRLAPVAGVYADAWEDSDWKVSTSTRLGIVIPSGSSRRELGLGFIAHWGLSTQRQFYQEKSEYYGMEIRFSL